jgi:transcriptional regulator with XRE-family HTH domain
MNMPVTASHRTIDEWEALVGDQVRRLRIARDLDQKTLAARADVSVGAISNLERGNGSSLATLIAVLRALDRTDWFESLAPAVDVSPMQLIRTRRRPRARVRMSRRGSAPSDD